MEHVFVRPETLMARWEATFPGRTALGRELVTRYGAVVRAYHDLRHLHEVLEAVDVLADAAQLRSADRDAVRLAAWFHDAVYDVRRDDNEEQSATWAQWALPAYDVPDAVVDEVARLVRVTRHHEPASDDVPGSVLSDADLAILGARPERYAEYTRDVRSEYSHLDDATFAAGRRAVLTSFLDRQTVYGTETGRARWGAAAEANLRRELGALDSGRVLGARTS